MKVSQAPAEFFAEILGNHYARRGEAHLFLEIFMYFFIHRKLLSFADLRLCHSTIHFIPIGTANPTKQKPFRFCAAWLLQCNYYIACQNRAEYWEDGSTANKTNCKSDSAARDSRNRHVRYS